MKGLARRLLRAETPQIFDALPMPLACRLLLLSLAFSGPALAAPIYKYVDANGVVTYTDKAQKGAKVMTFSDDPIERLDQRVKLQPRHYAGGTVLEVRNDSFLPVTVTLRLSALQNVSGVGEAPIRKVLPARSLTRLATLIAPDPGRPQRYTPQLTTLMGSATPVFASGFAYPLPWLGGPFNVSQGAGGGFSHNTPKSRYAVDIAMPEGTPIVVSRAGQVVEVENDQDGRGNHPSGNFVRILHDDGTMSVYLHLQRGSIKVAEGQWVRPGQPLASSGNTGRSTGPHLHFVVQRNTGEAVESIPFRFAQAVDSLPNFAVGGP